MIPVGFDASVKQITAELDTKDKTKWIEQLTSVSSLKTALDAEGLNDLVKMILNDARMFSKHYAVLQSKWLYSCLLEAAYLVSAGNPNGDPVKLARAQIKYGWNSWIWKAYKKSSHYSHADLLN